LAKNNRHIEEKTLELLNDINQLFTTTTYGLVNRLRYELSSGKRKKAIDRYKDKLQTLFTFYRSMIMVVDINATYIEKRPLREGETYKSFYDTENYTNWCEGVAIYKGIELPVFVDDYGMRAYVEYKNYLGETRCADFDLDWDFAFENDTMMAYLLTVHTVKQCDEAMEYIDNNKLFKEF